MPTTGLYNELDQDDLWSFAIFSRYQRQTLTNKNTGTGKKVHECLMFSLHLYQWDDLWYLEAYSLIKSILQQIQCSDCVLFSNLIADDNTIGIIKDATFYIFYDV